MAPPRPLTAVPDIRYSEPPFTKAAEPDCRYMVPPLPPILMYTDSPRPDSALPVPIYKAPLMPAVVAPVLMMSWPLTPAVPEFGVRNARFPLEYSVPIPETMLTAPPDNVDKLPPLSWHRKRQSPPPEAMPCGTISRRRLTRLLRWWVPCSSCSPYPATESQASNLACDTMPIYSLLPQAIR
jgi:hypothetical protein